MRKTRAKAIRQYCLDCCCGQSFEVKNCPAESCPLWPFRYGHSPICKKSDIPEDTPLPYGNSFSKAIYAKCTDCAGKDKRNCPMTDCPLYEYRVRRNYRE